MPRAAFTQASIQRAVSALEGMGKTVRGVEVRRDGSILVLVDTGEPPRDTPAPGVPYAARFQLAAPHTRGKMTWASTLPLSCSMTKPTAGLMRLRRP